MTLTVEEDSGAIARFPMLGLDVDNDSAFINETVVNYCRERNNRTDKIPRHTKRTIRHGSSRRTARW